MTLTASVVVATRTRPQLVRSCLTQLAALRTAPLEIVVVDASPDDETARLVAEEFPDVALVRNELGPPTTGASRRLGYRATDGDVVAFLDDHAAVDPEWLEELLAPYRDAHVVGVAGRALSGIDGEETAGLSAIGRLLPDGRLTENFAADPGRVIEIDHMPGATMSVRRSALDAIGGIRAHDPGTGFGEASDISLRLRQAGGTLLFQPRAVVHLAATADTSRTEPSARRQLYSSRRHHIMLLARVLGWHDPLVRRYARTVLLAQRDYVRSFAWRLGPRYADGSRRALTARLMAPVVLTHAVAEVTGLVAGVAAALRASRGDRNVAPRTSG